MVITGKYMHQTSKKEQKPPFLPLQHAPITLTGGNLYAVSSVPDCQTDRPITYLHTHDSAEFGICLEGNGVFMIGGRIFPFRGGDCTFIPAWLPHLAQSAAHTVSRWYWLSLDTARLLVWAPELADLDCFHGEGTPSLFPAETHPKENRLIAELFDIVRSPDRAYVARRLSAVLALFSSGLHRRFRPAGDGNGPCIERVRKALDLLFRNSSKPLAVKKLAEACSLSENQFRRVFSRATGRTPQEYLNELRIAMAVSLLRGGTLTLSEVAAECGYPTLSSFNRQFRRQRGSSPGRFRRSLAGETP